MTKALLRRFRVRELGFEFDGQVVNMESFSVDKYSPKWRAAAERSFRT